MISSKTKVILVGAATTAVGFFAYAWFSRNKRKELEAPDVPEADAVLASRMKDVELAERVEAAIEPVLSDVSNLEVSAKKGTVFLSGDVPEGEASDLISTVEAVEGVTRVEADLH
jgi:osmotically-inducible protein OsmY